jgi:1-acyl-sn-glycerol-3-phosphate acyltransferase
VRRYPGTIRVEVLDPIPPGLGKAAFLERLQADIEGQTARLIEEGRRELAQYGIALETAPMRH